MKPTERRASGRQLDCALHVLMLHSSERCTIACAPRDIFPRASRRSDAMSCQLRQPRPTLLARSRPTALRSSGSAAATMRMRTPGRPAFMTQPTQRPCQKMGAPWLPSRPSPGRPPTRTWPLSSLSSARTPPRASLWPILARTGVPSCCGCGVLRVRWSRLHLLDQLYLLQTLRANFE